MATANLFNREVSANKSPRNAFDVSYSTLFTSPLGLLLPTYVQEVKRGDKLKLGVTHVTRTAPVNTSAFMAFDEKTDFWFVPYRLLWSDYDNYMIGQTYRHSTLDLQDVGKQNFLPYCRYSNVEQYFYRNDDPDFFSPNAPSALRYLDLLGYSVPSRYHADGNLYTLIKNSDSYDPEETTASNPINAVGDYYATISNYVPMNYFRLAAFQCIYQHGYRNEEYEELDPSFYNVDNIFPNGHYDNSNTEYDDTTPSSLSPIVDDSNRNLISLPKLFTPRYKNWRKDIFTSAKPNNGFSTTGLEIGTDTSAASSTYGSGFYWPTNTGSRPFPTHGYSTDNNPGRYNPIGDYYDGDNDEYVSDYDATRIDWTFQTYGNNPSQVLQRLAVISPADSDISLALLYPQNIRNLMAQDKFVRASIYADKSLPSQIKAIFGYDVNDPHKPVYLGSYSSQLNIDDVVATASGGTGDTASVLGEIAGKGKQAGDKNEVFEKSFDDDGVVIGVHYMMPRNNYDSYRIDKFNTKISRFDYFYPEFDGLGYQPILAYERHLPQVNWTSNSLFGFAPRYYEYKQRLNEVHGSFQYEQPDDDWTITNNTTISLTTANDPYVYKIMPYLTDRIFTMDYDGSPVSDPFQHYYFYNVTKVSDMEVFGTPSL